MIKCAKKQVLNVFPERISLRTWGSQRFLHFSSEKHLAQVMRRLMRAAYGRKQRFRFIFKQFLWHLNDFVMFIKLSTLPSQLSAPYWIIYLSMCFRLSDKMNNTLLDRLSPRPACPLVRLGRTTPLLDSQQPSSSGSQNDDPDDYYMHNLDKRNLELYTRKINDRFYDYKETSFQSTTTTTQSQGGNPRSGGKNYYNRPDGPLNSLSLSAGLAYWESCKSMQSSDSSQECSEFFDARMRHTGRPKKRENFTPNSKSKGGLTLSNGNTNLNGSRVSGNSDSDYLMDSFLKLGKNSPSLDQGYHTLVPPSPGCSTPNIWDRCETQLYRGKSRFHARNNSFDRLQDELVMKVFSMLNSYELSICARVCRRFDRLVWKPELWRTITLAGETLSGDRAVRAVLRQLCGQGTTGACTQVERVHITDGAKITDKGVTLLARRCPEITHLQITQTAGVTNASLNEIVNRCGNLQHLDVTG